MKKFLSHTVAVLATVTCASGLTGLGNLAGKLWTFLSDVGPLLQEPAAGFWETLARGAGLATLASAGIVLPCLLATEYFLRGKNPWRAAFLQLPLAACVGIPLLALAAAAWPSLLVVSFPVSLLLLHLLLFSHWTLYHAQLLLAEPFQLLWNLGKAAAAHAMTRAEYTQALPQTMSGALLQILPRSVQKRVLDNAPSCREYRRLLQAMNTSDREGVLEFFDSRFWEIDTSETGNSYLKHKTDGSRFLLHHFLDPSYEVDEDKLRDSFSFASRNKGEALYPAGEYALTLRRIYGDSWAVAEIAKRDRPEFQVTEEWVEQEPRPPESAARATAPTTTTQTPQTHNE